MALSICVGVSASYSDLCVCSRATTPNTMQYMALCEIVSRGGGTQAAQWYLPILLRVAENIQLKYVRATGEPHCNDRCSSIGYFYSMIDDGKRCFSLKWYITGCRRLVNSGKRTVIRTAKFASSILPAFLHEAKSNISVLTRAYRRTRHAFYHASSYITYTL